MAGLYLSSLTLSHFRSHKRAVIEVDARPVAIHGNNGAGKTNILEAVSLLSPGRGLRRSSAEDMTRRPEALGWKITALLHGPMGISEIEVISEKVPRGKSALTVNPRHKQAWVVSRGFCGLSPRWTGFGLKGPKGAGASWTV